MSKPTLRHVANLWTFVQHPSKENEWSLEEKLRAIKEAGFDGVCWGPLPGLKEGLARHGLFFLGGMSSAKAAEFPRLLQDLKDAGAHHVNVQLADEDTLTLAWDARFRKSGSGRPLCFAGVPATSAGSRCLKRHHSDHTRTTQALPGASRS